MKSIYFFLLLIFITFSGCLDPVEFKFDGPTEHLVVEAKFTNLTGLNYVRLSESKPYDYPFNVNIEDAEVYISGEEGECFSFRHVENGYYLPDDGLKGIVGNSYTLHIENEGKVYQSGAVTLLPPVPVDSVYFRFDEELHTEKGKKEKRLKPGYRVLVDFTDPAGEQNFYRWSYKSLFEVHTQPWNNLDRNIPRPKKCCRVCYVRMEEDFFDTVNDRLSDGRKITSTEVFFIPFQKYLNYKYKLELFQYSISEEAFSYFKTIEEQYESTGSIFDPPPSEAKGNIFNTEDKQEQVIGIFDVSGASIKKVTLTFDQIPYYKPPFVFADDCLELENSTTIKPGNW